jgi:RNA-directed DNA polymerase
MNIVEQAAQPAHLYKIFRRYQRKYTSRREGRYTFRPGWDGETLGMFAAHLSHNLHTLSQQLRSGSYQFSPFIEAPLRTSSGKVKIISRSIFRDLLVQKAIALIAEPLLDLRLQPNSYAFRRVHGPSMKDAVREVVRRTRAGSYWVVKEDVRAYFDHIQHDLLLDEFARLSPDAPDLLALYRTYLAAPRAVDGQLLPRQVGVPVGSVWANFLSNIYLDPLDRQMAAEDYCYLRYCDDILVFTTSEAEAKAVQARIAEITACLGLTLNSDKEQLLPPGHSFIYLGYEFGDGHVRIGRRALAKFKRRIRRVTARRRWASLLPRDLESERGCHRLGQLVGAVNAEIVGHDHRNWVRYFSRCDDESQFRELDAWIRDRIRAAVTKRWSRGNYARLPTSLLREQGLRSLVNEYYRWRNRWREWHRSLIHHIARLDHLRATLATYKARYFDYRQGGYAFRPGADGQSMADFLENERTNLSVIQEALLQGEYEFSPFVEYDKAKQSRTDARIISRATLADTVVQKAIAKLVEPRYDGRLSPHAYAYRRGRSQFTAVGDMLRLLRQREAWWVVQRDLANFLDNIDLDLLSAEVEAFFVDEPEVANLYLKYLRVPRLRDGELLPRQVGLPRGGILTPFLSNLALRPFDDRMADYVYLRYADDILVLCTSQAEAREAEAVLDEVATALHLRFNPAKCHMLSPGEPFEYLGYQVVGRELTVRPYAVRRLQKRIRRITCRRRWQHLTLAALQTEAGCNELRRLVRQVNRAIVYGPDNDWARPFARVTNDAQFREMDRWIADRVRACVTGRWSSKNRRRVPDSLLREMGLKKLISRLYRWKRQVWTQGFRRGLDSPVPSFSELVPGDEPPLAA